MLFKFYRWLHQKFSLAEERGEYSAGYWQHLVRQKALTALANLSGNILDLGCGEGLLIAKLAKQNSQALIYGLDCWPQILIKAQARCKNEGINNVKFGQGELSRLPFEDNYFDAVVCVNVFFNLASWDYFVVGLNEVYRVLKPHGIFIFDLRNSLNPFLRIKYKLARYYDPTVKNLALTTYQEKTVIRQLKQIGFSLKREYLAFPKNMFSPLILIQAQK